MADANSPMAPPALSKRQIFFRRLFSFVVLWTIILAALFSGYRWLSDAVFLVIMVVLAAAGLAEFYDLAQKDKLVVTTTVSNIGVEMLTGNTARVLVFATESDGSAGATTPTTAEAMLAVNAVLDGSTWKIEGIDTFGG